MILFLAHSMTLKAEALALKERLVAAGYKVLMPYEAHPNGDFELLIFRENADRILKAGAVFALWNGTSDGTPMDVAMSIALGKPVYVEVVPMQPGTRRHFSRREMHVRAWALFSELPTIEEWWKKQPATTRGARVRHYQCRGWISRAGDTAERVHGRANTGTATTGVERDRTDTGAARWGVGDWRREE